MSGGTPTLTIGNVYGHGFDAARVGEMERLGFALRPGISHYAGSQVMRFIDFARGPALELIDVEDPSAYADFVPKGMVPYCPGISLVINEDSQKPLAHFEDESAALHPYRFHVNYDGTEDPGKPGCTYMNFGTPVVRDTFIWLTQYDEPRPARPPPAPQPNGVERVLGLVFDVEAHELGRLAQLAGTDVVDGVLDLAGVKIWPRDRLRDVPQVPDKRFPLSAIVLMAGDLEAARRRAPGAGRATLRSRPAVHLRTHERSWDLLITTP